MTLSAIMDERLEMCVHLKVLIYPFDVEVHRHLVSAYHMND